MNKYIDAEKLIHDLEERIYVYSKGYSAGDLMRKDATEALLRNIKHQYSHQYTLQQDQPNMDLEKELKKCQEHYILVKEKGFSLDWTDIETTARHFFELGLNARKEE